MCIQKLNNFCQTETKIEVLIYTLFIYLLIICTSFAVNVHLHILLIFHILSSFSCKSSIIRKYAFYYTCCSIFLLFTIITEFVSFKFYQHFIYVFIKAFLTPTLFFLSTHVFYTFYVSVFDSSGIKLVVRNKDVLLKMKSDAPFIITYNQAIVSTPCIE